MAKAIGFGQTTTPAGKKKQTKRELQAKQYAEMKSKGLPEFNIYVRIPNKEWLPAGSMTVERSSQINRAIFQQEAELRKSIFRLLPRLQKYQDQLEYGYRLKEFPDEPIVKAERPTSTPNPLAQAWQRFSQFWKH
jgi:hypothetical protein